MKTFKGIYVILILFILINKTNAQSEQYGSNDKSGHFCNVGDAKIYYEVYGQGSPILLLHGGLGYIDMFKEFIPTLSQHYKVIAIATRGHGKSEIGTKPFSYKLFAEDAIAVLKNESNDSAIVIGISDGATTAYVLAAEYPESICKVIAMGGGLNLQGYNEWGLNWIETFTAEWFEKSNPIHVKRLKDLMPEPERWTEYLEKMKIAWMQFVYVPYEKALKIRCPILIIAGDRDEFRSVENFVDIYNTIPNSQLCILPNYTHMDLVRNPMYFVSFVLPFVQQ